MNNNFYNLKGGIPIPQGADLYDDVYKVPGNYYCSQDSTVRTLKNCPSYHAFTMKVESATGVASIFYPCQTIRDFLTGETFYRVYNGDKAVWMDDTRYVMDPDLNAGWTPLTLLNGFYTGIWGGTPAYKKIGNIVFVRGGVGIDNRKVGEKTFMELPSGLHPPVNHYCFAACSGFNIARIYIRENGAFILEWIKKIATGEEYEGNMPWIDITTFWSVN